MSGKYRKLPVTIDAFQMTRARRENNADWPQWLHEAWQMAREASGALYPKNWPHSDDTDNLVVCTLEGVMRVDWDDWIIRGVKGELYPCKPDVFEKTYKPVAAAHCADCLEDYGSPRFPDLVLPTHVWRRISPTGDEGGLLCPNCIFARLENAGLSEIRGVFRSGPLCNGLTRGDAIDVAILKIDDAFRFLVVDANKNLLVDFVIDEATAGPGENSEERLTAFANQFEKAFGIPWRYLSDEPDDEEIEEERGDRT